MTQTDFASLGLSAPLLRALELKEYSTPTPIQVRSIPHLLDGRDLLGIAQTGTGKTAAFALPMLQLLAKDHQRPAPMRPTALVLAPTRELATQIAASFRAYGHFLRLQVGCIFGGVGQEPQVQALRRGLDILVATPGRLLDLIQQRHCNLGDVDILVLDEADRMLDMGFLPDVRRILSTLPRERQSLLFSATMPPDITRLANSLLHDPLRVEVTPPAATVDRIAQSVWFVKKDKKRDLLVELLDNPAFERTLVFTRTKHGADRVAKFVDKAGIEAHAIHGNKSQGARERALDAFRNGRCHVLVATDIAARGIDVPEITHVINFDLPNIPESYVHRIGRTARAGRDGIAISFCDEGEHEYLRDIEKLIKKRIPIASGKGRPGPAEPRADARPPAKAAPARHADNPWHQEADASAESPAPAVKKERQRPPAREAPGPYEPSPERGAPRPRPAYRGHKPERPARPAQPRVVDPEVRRPGPRPEHHGSGSRDPRPGSRPGQRPGQRPGKPHSGSRRPGSRRRPR